MLGGHIFSLSENMAPSPSSSVTYPVHEPKDKNQVKAPTSFDRVKDTREESSVVIKVHGETRYNRSLRT